MSQNEDRSMNVIMISFMAIIHGGFWLGVGLAVGKLLWGI